MRLTDMDLVRGAICNALLENMSLLDLWIVAEHAATVDDFETAVNELAQTIPDNTVSLTNS